MNIILVILLISFSLGSHGSDLKYSDFISEFESVRIKGGEISDFKSEYVRKLLNILEIGDIKNAILYKQSLQDEKLKNHITAQLFYETGYISKLCSFSHDRQLHYYIALCEFVRGNYKSAIKNISKYQFSYLNKLILASLELNKRESIKENDILKITDKYKISKSDIAYFYNEFLGGESAFNFCEKNKLSIGQCKYIKIVNIKDRDKISKLLGTSKTLGYYEYISIMAALVESQHLELYEMMAEFGFNGCDGFYYECLYINASVSLRSKMFDEYIGYYKQMIDMWPTNIKNKILNAEYNVGICLNKSVFIKNLTGINGPNKESWLRHYDNSCNNK